MVRDLAERPDLPAPSAITRTPHRDGWLEDRTRRSHGSPASPKESPRDRSGRSGWGGRGDRGDRGGGEGRYDIGSDISGDLRGEIAGAGDGLSGIRSSMGNDPAAPGRRGAPTAPVLVIGSPFLWWMRVGELRAVLAPVVAGTGPSAHPDIAAARRFVRGLDAAVAVTTAPARGPLARTMLSGAGWVARLLLRSCRGHAAE